MNSFDVDRHFQNKIKRPSSAKYPSLSKNNNKSQNETLEHENNINNYLKPPLLIKNNNVKKFSKNSTGALSRKSPRNRTTQEPEQLMHEQFLLKQKVNDYQEENIRIKTRVAQLEKELLKMEKIMEEMSLMNVNSGNKQLIQKFADTNTLFQLKKQGKDLKVQLEQKEEELLRIKRSLKNTKIMEIEHENQTFLDQIQKITQILSKQQSKLSEANKISQYAREQEQKVSQQQIMLMNLKKDYNLLGEAAKELQKQNEQQASQIIKLQQSTEVQQLKSKIKTLSYQLKNYQDAEKTQKIMNQKSKNKGIGMNGTISNKDKYIEQLEQIIYEQQEVLKGEVNQLKLSRNFQNIKQEYYQTQSRTQSIVENKEVNQTQFENQLQQELFNILNDIKYRMLYEKFPKQRISFQFQHLTLDVLKKHPFFLTHQEAQFINQIFDTDVESVLNALSDFSTFSEAEEKTLAGRLIQYYLQYRDKIENYFTSQKKELINEDDIAKCFQQLNISISEREIQCLIYFAWKYIRNNDPEIRIRGYINWNWILYSLDKLANDQNQQLYSISKDHKNKRPLSAGEGRSLAMKINSQNQEEEEDDDDVIINKYQNEIQNFNESVEEVEDYEYGYGQKTLPEESIIEQSMPESKNQEYPFDEDDEPGTVYNSRFEKTPESLHQEGIKQSVSLGKSQGQLIQQYEISEANYVF